MRYELIHGLCLIKVAGQYMIVSLGGENGAVPYTNTVNETGAFYFNLLKSEKTVDEMVLEASACYGISDEEIRPGLMRFIQTFEEIGYIYRV